MKKKLLLYLIVLSLLLVAMLGMVACSDRTNNNEEEPDTPPQVEPNEVNYYLAKVNDGLEKIVFGCHSWLLSPVLRELLPAGSNILTFAGAYGLAAAEPQPGNPWTVFLFGHADPSRPEDFPEDSSLQRSVKRLLLEGREFPVGFGLMPFDG